MYVSVCAYFSYFYFSVTFYTHTHIGISTHMYIYEHVCLSFLCFHMFGHSTGEGRGSGAGSTAEAGGAVVKFLRVLRIAKGFAL